MSPLQKERCHSTRATPKIYFHSLMKRNFRVSLESQNQHCDSHRCIGEQESIECPHNLVGRSRPRTQAT
jgi:hypothetical protein